MRFFICFAKAFLPLTAFFLVSGCGSSSFTYHSDTEIPEGPGVFSGKSGEVTLYDSSTQAEKKTTESRAETTNRDDRQFVEFEQWKKEQTEFKAFQQWKQKAEGSEEGREFEEWQRWREFQRWQQQQEKEN